MIRLALLAFACLTFGLTASAEQLNVTDLPSKWIAKEVSAKNVAGVEITISSYWDVDCNDVTFRPSLTLISGHANPQDGMNDHFMTGSTFSMSAKDCPVGTKSVRTKFSSKPFIVKMDNDYNQIYLTIFINEGDELTVKEIAK